jgi:hypothetical protein
MMTAQDHAHHVIYENLPLIHQRTVDRMFTVCGEALHEGGITPAMDDRADALVAALSRFLVESTLARLVWLES